MAGVGRIAKHDREPPAPLGLIYGFGFAGQGVHLRQPQLLVRRIERVGQVHARPFVAGEAVAGFIQLEADLQVGDGVGRHEDLVTVQAGEQVTRNVLVPECRDPGLVVSLRPPLRAERAVDHVDHLDQKGAGTGGRIEYPHEVLLRRHVLGNDRSVEAIRHLSPGGRIGQAIGQSELAAQQGVQGAHDIAHDRARRVEDAALHALGGVVLLEEQLVEVDYRILARVAVAEVTHHGFHVCGIDQLHHLGGAKLVEVDSAPPAALPPADLQEGVEQRAQKRAGMHVAGKVVRRRAPGIGYAGREQAVGNGLGVHVGEVVGAQIVQQRLPERLHQPGDRPARRLDGEDVAHPAADGAGQGGQTHRQDARRRDHFAVAQREGGAPPLTPGVDVLLVGRPSETVGQIGGYGVEAQRGVTIIPAQHLERRQVAPVPRGREVRKADPPGVARAVVGDEQQIVRRPGLPLRPARGCPLL